MRPILTLTILSFFLLSSMQAQDWDVDQALMRFTYENTPGPPPAGPLISRWEVGVGNDFSNPDYFTFSQYKFVLDFIIKQHAMVFSDDNLFVGIGSDEPQSKLHVNYSKTFGNDVPAVHIGPYSGSGHGYLTINKPENDVNDNIARFRDNGATTVKINEHENAYQLDVNGDMQADAYYLSSDANFKTDIRDITHAMDILSQINPRAYQFKPELQRSRNLPSEKQYGLLAQEVEQVLPELVKKQADLSEEGEEQGEIYSVNYLGFVPILIAANQEMADQLTAVKNENTALKSRIQSIENTVEKLLRDQ